MKYIARFEDLADLYYERLVIIESDKMEKEIENILKEIGGSAFLYNICGEPCLDADFRFRSIVSIDEISSTTI